MREKIIRCNMNIRLDINQTRTPIIAKITRFSIKVVKDRRDRLQSLNEKRI